MHSSLSFHPGFIWVIKVGSSILTTDSGAPDPVVFESIAQDVAFLLSQKQRVVLISSGAIACGMYHLGLSKKPAQIPQKQAIAATGQITLMNQYEKVFSALGRKTAQILLTREDLSDRERYLNARHSIHQLLEWEILPIINENDTVAVEEIKFGDNDNLAALVANVVEADLLVILTDQEGLYTADPRYNPHAQKITVIQELTSEHKMLAKDTQRAGSTGGMITKLEAAQKAGLFGIPTIIASGKKPKELQKLFSHDSIGTLILPHEARNRLSRRKHWIAFTLKAAGTLWVDAGAKEFLTHKGKSLLPSGVQKITGQFQKGDPVDICVAGEKPFARGLASYNSSELEKIKGMQSHQIEEILGYKYLEEIIHRNDLVLL